MTREVKDRGHDAFGNVVSDTQKKREHHYLLAPDDIVNPSQVRRIDNVTKKLL